MVDKIIPSNTVFSKHLPSGIACDGDAEQEFQKLARRLAKHCNAYRGAVRWRSLFQLISTVILFFATLALCWIGFEAGYMASLLLTLPAAGLLVRLFIFQHDCGHRSFFKSLRANDFVGRLVSVLTFTPYAFWRRAHEVHHATSGNLSRRGIGDIDTLTVKEYRALSRRKRLFYRVYRHPVVFLLLGAPFHFILFQRIPFGQVFPFRDIWRSVMGLNLALVAFYGGLMALCGVEAVLFIYLPVIVMAAWIGGWLFFIQHQFEDTYWQHASAWDFRSSAIMGSSYYVLPRLFQWFTGNIGLHHIHHLCGKIPNYRLQECLDASTELQSMCRLTFLESLKCARLALWDEEAGKLVRFRDLKPA